jgi:hypothetical protein
MTNSDKLFILLTASLLKAPILLCAFFKFSSNVSILSTENSFIDVFTFTSLKLNSPNTFFRCMLFGL